MADAVGTRSRIAVIDDNADFLDLMRDLLSERYEVVALSGKGLTPHAIADCLPDMVMVDLHLDGDSLQGWEIVTLLRAHRRLRSVPILVCSADQLGLGAQADRMLAMGNTALIVKPFSLDALEELINHGLSGRFPGTAPAEGHLGEGSFGPDGSADPVLVADEESRYVDANEAALRLLEITRDELCQLTVADLVVDQPSWTEAEWRRFVQAGWWQGTVTLAPPRGLPCRVLATAHIVEAGGVRSYVSRLRPVG